MKSFRVALVAAVLVIGLVGSSFAQTNSFPTKPITLIVPFPAGGVSDILARAFADAAQGIISQPIHVVNRGGGSGTIANYEVVRARPDGHTWLWASTGHLSSTLHIVQAQYDMDDFTVVNKVGEMVTALVVPKNSPYETLEEYLAAAAQSPRRITLGNPGEGTVVTLLALLLQNRTDVELTNIPFQGSGPLLTAVMGGHVNSALMNVPEVRGQVGSGGLLRALAVLSESRVDLMSDVPSSYEQGIQVSGGAGHFIVIPNGVPDDVVAKIDQETRKVYESEKFRNATMSAGYQLGYKTGAEAREELEAWYDVTRELYQQIGRI